MGWPTDPEKRAQAAARHRAAQQARRARDEDRAHARAMALRQFADFEARRRMSELKRAQYASDPSIKEKISAALTGRPAPATPARLEGIRAAIERRNAERTARVKRLSLIRSRVVASRYGTSPQT